MDTKKGSSKITLKSILKILLRLLLTYWTLDCEPHDILVNGVKPSNSFFLVLSFQEVYSRRLFNLNKQDRLRLMKLNIDFFIVYFDPIFLQSREGKLFFHVYFSYLHKVAPEINILFYLYNIPFVIFEYCNKSIICQYWWKLCLKFLIAYLSWKLMFLLSHFIRSPTACPFFPFIYYIVDFFFEHISAKIGKYANNLVTRVQISNERQEPSPK